MSAELKLEHLKKIFRDRHSGKEVAAVKDFNLTLRPGELLTLLGPSGCGKTTVLRMLAGFEKPTSGEIVLNGTKITQLPPNKRDSAMVFQSYALFPHMNVRENVEYGLKFRNLSKIERKSKAEKIMEIVGLQSLENRRTSELSGGQQQRVALARALVVEPKILLFDEPLSNLDAKLRETMRSEIRRIQQRLSITAVYVTHDQLEAMSLSDRIVVMNKGEIEQIGSPVEIYHSPRTKFVADFMGVTNFLEGELIKDSSNSFRFKSSALEVNLPRKMNYDSLGKSILLVRPEDIILNSSGKLKGELVSFAYLGEKFELTLKLSNSEKIVGRIKTESDWKLPAMGSQISFDLMESHLICLPI